MTTLKLQIARIVARLSLVATGLVFMLAGNMLPEHSPHESGYFQVSALCFMAVYILSPNERRPE